MTQPEYHRARQWCFVSTDAAVFTGRISPDGLPEVRHEVRGIAPGALTTLPTAEAAQMVAAGKASPFVPEVGSKLAAILRATLDCLTAGEAAEAGGRIRDVGVWMATHDGAGHLRAAPAQGGSGGPTIKAFRNIAEVRAHWEESPDSIPVFILNDNGRLREFAWLNQSLLEFHCRTEKEIYYEK